MVRQYEIWECDDERARLWVTDPSRAAMLAYLDVLSLWHEQVEEGIYWGIPALHRLPSTPSAQVLEFEPSTQRSRPARYAPDESAGHWVVPSEIQSRWLAVA